MSDQQNENGSIYRLIDTAEAACAFAEKNLKHDPGKPEFVAALAQVLDSATRALEFAKSMNGQGQLNKRLYGK